MAGVTWQATPVVRLDLLAEGGLSTYFNVGQDLFVTHVEGDRFALLPFAGVRAGLGWRFGPRKQGVVGLYQPNLPGEQGMGSADATIGYAP